MFWSRSNVFWPSWRERLRPSFHNRKWQRPFDGCQQVVRLNSSMVSLGKLGKLAPKQLLIMLILFQSLSSVKWITYRVVSLSLFSLFIYLENGCPPGLLAKQFINRRLVRHWSCLHVEFATGLSQIKLQERGQSMAKCHVVKRPSDFQNWLPYIAVIQKWLTNQPDFKASWSTWTSKWGIITCLKMGHLRPETSELKLLQMIEILTTS